MFSRPALAMNQHSAKVGSDASNLQSQALHRCAVADDLFICSIEQIGKGMESARGSIPETG
jgi:hypothetical protein